MVDYRGKRILIVDDEEDLCEILKYNLDNEGFITDVAHSAEEALKKPLTEFDLILLDVMMGQMSGFKMADKLRKELSNNVPVVFLTAKDTENDLLTGFSLGADDYVSKPFSINELTARIKAVLKRYLAEENNEKNRIISGSIELDPEGKKLFIEGEPADLTKKEFEIISLLIRNPGKLYSREAILDLIWAKDVIVTSRTVDVNIARIRTKLGKYGVNLKNKTGYGYYFENIK
ncbi:MAG: response regulator transcription factor [Bacteroidales bacterium]|jgi:DNA-binding response OmpR family regulator